MSRAVLIAELEIPGRPQPQQRHRVRGRGLGMFDPSAPLKKSLGIVLRAAMKGQGPLKGPVMVEIEARLDSVKRRTKPSSGRETTIVRLYSLTDAGYSAAPEDADNIAKLILDAANGIWFEDDRQVAVLRVEKRATEV